MNLIVLILILLLLFGGIGVAPTWGYHSYGWYPSIGIVVLIIILVLLFR